MVDRVGVEPTFIQLCTNRLEGAANTDPLNMVVPIGFEPTTRALSTHCSKPTELRDN